MEEVFSNKYILLAIGILIFIGSVVIGMSVLSSEDVDDKVVKEFKVYNYKMYVKADEVIKFDFEAAYEECRDSHNKRYACGNYKDSIKKYELINKDNSIFNNVNFNDKSILDTLSLIIDLAIKNNPELKQLKIITNYEFDYKDINEEIKKKLNLKDEFKIIGITRKELVEEAIINELNDTKVINTYKVTFDTDNGSLINDQEIVENELLIKPVVPTKDGYIFVEWQLDGVKFNFNTPITSDMILTAVWKELKEVEYDNEMTTTTTIAQVNNNNDEKTTTKTTTTKKTSSKNLSTFNKINLNDNISVYIEGSGSTCGYYYFSKGIDDDGNPIYDEEKENYVISELDKIKNNLPKGIKEFNYTLEDHKLNVSYTAIQISNKYNYSTLYNTWKNSIKKLTNIWDGANYTGAGACSSTQSKATQLNESLCSEFNLTCSRW